MNLNNFKTIWPINSAITGTAPSGESGPGSNDNEGVHHTTGIS